jgi:hypothetical protein
MADNLGHVKETIRFCGKTIACAEFATLSSNLPYYRKAIITCNLNISIGDGLSNNEEPKSDEGKAALPLSNIDMVLSVVDSIRGKGGHCSRDVLKTTFGKSKAAFDFAFGTAVQFELVELKEKDCSLSPLGSKLSSANEDERKKIIRDIVLSYQPYHTMLLRLKNSPDSSLPKGDLTKAWFELNKTGTDRTRQQYTSSFGSICEWCGLIDKRKKTIVLRDEAKAFLEGAPPAISLSPPTGSVPKQLSEGDKPQSHLTTNPLVASPLNATITISITVDAKEQTSVDNLLRIIKALRGENVSPS